MAQGLVHQRQYSHARTALHTVTDARTAHAHCHAYYERDEENLGREPNYLPIRNSVNAQARCPSWILGTVMQKADADDDFDAGLLDGLYEQTRGSRQWVLAALDSVQKILPGDSWVYSTHIRLLIDAGRKTAAVNLARTCTLDRWTCASLLGYALYKSGNVAAADSVFMHGISALPPEQQCALTDVRMLLPREEKDDETVYKQYVAASCEERAAINARYWWLADPLFVTRGNERRAAHVARQVLVQLHSSTPQDERYWWSRPLGSEATSEMLIRYGWPTASVRISGEEDKNHDGFLKTHGAKPAAPYSTSEYSPDRYHFGAAQHAIENPFDATVSDWQLSAPSDMRTMQPGTELIWWPTEHARFGGSLVQLPAGQFAMLRRDSHVQLLDVIDATAADSSARATLSPLLGAPLNFAMTISSAMRVARWLQTRPEVARVIYPALPEDPGYALWKRTMSGASGLFGVIMTGWSAGKARAFADGLALFGIGASWGGFESLVTLPHIPRSAKKWEAEGPLFRLHIGLEDPDDLIADLEASFARVAAMA